MQRARAEMPFELIDAPAHRIGRQAQTPRRLGEAAGADDVDKHRQIVQVEHGISSKNG